MAKPFLKWAGGKGQLLPAFQSYYPAELLEGGIRRYVEPMVGGGAVFFHIAGLEKVDELCIADINEELMLAYMAIKNDVKGVIAGLESIQAQYLGRPPRDRRDFYYEVRQLFNDAKPQFRFAVFSEGWVERCAQLIFLNRTCYNGLFRVNSRGEFNVPHGDYKSPRICDGSNLESVASILRRTQIRRGDFTTYQDVVDHTTFVYFDPPYRPISPTSSFTSYHQSPFDDAEQVRLAEYFHAMHGRGAKLMLSNSDPTNTDPADSFFEKLYGGPGICISRVPAIRLINCNAAGRGPVNEIIVTNYPPPDQASALESVVTSQQQSFPGPEWYSGHPRADRSDEMETLRDENHA